MRSALVVLALLTGCMSTSQVGPYVKHVQRNGDWLVVHKCMIVLEGDTIHEQACTVEQVPLRTLAMQPPPTAMPPGPPGPQPVAPPTLPPPRH